MLVDFVLRTAEQSAEDIVEPLISAGIDGVIFDNEDSALAEAISSSTLHGFPAHVYGEDGAYIMLISEDDIEMKSLSLSDWLKTLETTEGVAIASHPYDRSQGRPWGDRIYRLKGLSAVAATASNAARSRDQLARTAARKLGLSTVAGSFGDSSAVGHLATVIDTDGVSATDVINALKSKETLVCRLESADTPYTPPTEPSFERSSARGGERNRRDDQRGSGRGRRGPRRR